MGNLDFVFSVVFVAVILGLWKLFMDLIWRPYAITRRFAKQGIRGPSYSLLTGSLKEIEKLEMEAKQKPMDPSSHDVTPKVLPYYHRWSQEYGETFLFWFGTQARLSIVEPELIKEVLSTKFGYYTVEKPTPSVHALLGNGLLSLGGVDWVRHRRAVNPAFNMDKLKGMTKGMAACTLTTLNRWANEVSLQTNDNPKELNMHKEFMELTGDIIAHTSFGTSYNEGKEVFEVERELHHMVIASFTDVYIPGREYIPTKWNRRMWMLERKLRNHLKSIIESKLNSVSDGESGDDLLGLLMGISNEGSKKNKMESNLTIDEIIDECKTFFFAGHETSSNLLTWAMYFLATNHEWQKKLREEVESVCGTEIPDADKLARLKLVGMVLYETLRLYSPVITTERIAMSELKLGKLVIPKDTVVTFPFPIIHRNKKYWGEDADEFNPLRFADGFSRAAKHPNALIAFSMGPRVCVGQNFAILETKTVLAMILQRFSFTLSPTYKHSPVNNILLQPEFGVPIILKPLHVES